MTVPARVHRLRIEAGQGTRLNLGELWESRELLPLLAGRDLKVRYQQTLLGASWIVLQPVLMTVVFGFVFGRLTGGAASDGLPYTVFALTGILAWMHFAGSLTSAVNALVGSASLITKVYFPRLIVPAAAAAARVADLALGLVVLAVLLAYFRIAPGPAVLALPVLVLLSSLFAFGLGLWLSAFNLRYRDVGHTLPFLLQIWMFCTPVVYSEALLPPRWHGILRLNPMAGIVGGYRSLLLDRPLDWPALGVAAAVTVAILVPGLYVFKRLERTFADVI
jgi:lipopolysaccharide transport system permease protein